MLLFTRIGAGYMKKDRGKGLIVGVRREGRGGLGGKEEMCFKKSIQSRKRGNITRLVWPKQIDCAEGDSAYRGGNGADAGKSGDCTGPLALHARRAEHPREGVPAAEGEAGRAAAL